VSKHMHLAVVVEGPGKSNDHGRRPPILLGTMQPVDGYIYWKTVATDSSMDGMVNRRWPWAISAPGSQKMDDVLARMARVFFFL
jgi:hypothetical protein